MCFSFFKPKENLVSSCLKDDSEQLKLIFNNILFKKNKEINDHNKEKYLNTFQNRFLISLCVDNMLWKTLKVLIDYRVLTIEQIPFIEQSLVNNYAILDSSKITDLKNLLIAIKIYRNYNSKHFIPFTRFNHDHPYLHLLYAAGLDPHDILSDEYITKLDTILVNNLINKLNINGLRSNNSHLYVSINVNNNHNMMNDKFAILYKKIYEQLEFAFCNNLDNCIDLFNHMHAVSIMRWTSPYISNSLNDNSVNIDLENKIKIHYSNKDNIKSCYNFAPSNPSYESAKFVYII